MPPRRSSPVGSHVFTSGKPSGLDYVDQVGAEAVQMFVSNPRGWAQPRPSPDADAALAERYAERRLPVFVHAPYLVNLASPTALTRERSAAAIRHSLVRGALLGAQGVVIHAGVAVGTGERDRGLAAIRETLLPILDDLSDGDPLVLVEPTAGGGEPIAATVGDLGPLFSRLDFHPRLGVCLDTCHMYAAGHDVAAPGGLRRLLNELVRTIGRGRLQLVHANDSKDPIGSRRDRHAPIGTGTIGTEAFGELFRHPATRGVPVIVETPGDLDSHVRDITLLKGLRDRERVISR